MRLGCSFRRRGNIVVLTTLMLVVLLAMVAFAIDMGYIVHARTELQRTADACALAAAARLPDLDEARAIAQIRARENRATAQPGHRPKTSFLAHACQPNKENKEKRLRSCTGGAPDLLLSD